MEIHQHRDWKQTFRESLKSSKELADFLGESVYQSTYPVLIPRRLAEQIKQSGKNSPLWNQFVPSSLEENQLGLKDPIGDHLKSPVPRIVHRYKNRVLFFPIKVCPVQCRYCFRKNELHEPDQLFDEGNEKAFEYLEKHPEIEEVIFSGGDPFILDSPQLRKIFLRLNSMVHIKMLRFHTRVPVSLPERINSEFIELLNSIKNRFHLSLIIHMNHWDEWNPEAQKALEQLKEFNLLSQSVLLKGVNDSVEDLKQLFKNLSLNNIRPYYLHHPDQAKGTSHFWLEKEEGQILFQELRRELSGWMLPQYVVDSPSGEGKISVFANLDKQIH